MFSVEDELTHFRNGELRCLSQMGEMAKVILKLQEQILEIQSELYELKNKQEVA